MKSLRTLTLFLMIPLLLSQTGCKKWDVLSDQEKATLHRILAHWNDVVPARKAAGTAPLMSWKDLFDGLSAEEREFLHRVRNINPRKEFDFKGKFQGALTAADFVRIDNQQVEKPGGPEPLDAQYLPRGVHTQYEAMMNAMEKDTGKRLLVESGYRSPAYQLYTFLFYLPKHNYSLVETGHWVALPGWSEHGAPQNQAIDFINQQGINGEDRPEDFEALPEYEWLQKNAGRFGFELSYPRGKKGITFEPWHWRYTGRK